MKDPQTIFAVCFALVIVLCIYFIPAIVAAFRRHKFLWPIFALNLIGGWTGICWVLALVWSVWPSKTVITDVLTHDPTGLSSRNVGSAAREIRNEYNRP